MDNKSLGEMIRKKRKENHMTQEQLAQQLCISANAVSKWELGKNAIDQKNLEVISEVLNIPLSLLTNNQVEEPESDNRLMDSNDASCSQLDYEIGDRISEEPEILIANLDRRKTSSRKIILLLLGIVTVLVVVVVLLCSKWLSNRYSFVIQNEYVDTYEGQKACYLIADYKGKLTIEIMNEYSEIIRENYTDYFKEVEVIVILYYRDSRQEKVLGWDTADAVFFLYPYPY